MALPLNIEELITGKTVEWERIEFRKGWNPERVIKTITSFANDFNNWGGGYIILGIEEKDGKPVLPPAGIKISEIDKIQKELNALCRKIIPNYFPLVEPVDYRGKKILILWCPGGSVRPYKCPDSLSEKKPRYFYFIRRYSLTVKPTIEEEKELISMSNQIPFDDRVNHRHKISDFDLSAIRTFLNKVGSELEKDIPNLSIDEISRRMNIAEGAEENLLPKNVGLLFFAKEPQKIFPSARIDVVIFEDEAGIRYTEKIFDGNLFEQLFNVLDFLKNQIVKEKVVKRPGRAEADRFFNYPYEALE
ncbi:MAG: putative DNA binding domain-containing protein, partial [Caldisericaceae bacterium]|nr:putative DNA binding domain-containing protein [Caldisericaceae bacterium]